jgi:hypothetical protein
MKIVLITLIISVLCSACSVTNNWKGSSLPRNSYATFAKFSGTQKLKMTLDRATGLTEINYRIQLEGGEVRMIIKYKKEEIINVNISTVVEGSVHIENTGDPNIEVFLIGTKARGSYHIGLQNP